MLDPKTLDDLAQRLAGSVPSGVRELQQDLEKNLRATLQASLARLDLVTREEFDAQREVLARTRSKLQALERRVAELEARVIPARATTTRPEVENDMDGG
ncbi:MAG TPA: accessory factor UbiK family protein [Gammaproteobacteria bacterium]|nr:accessory factor UbiK family protein [Gammaproteobacteria bacterium]